MRARRRGGRWTPWLPLHRAGDHAPDGARAPAGTEPAYTGAADVFQLRLRGSAPRPARRASSRAQPTARAARHLTAACAAQAKAKLRARKSQSSQPAIITRTEWGGDSVPPRAAPEYGEVQAAFVHHTVSSNDYAPEESAGIVLGIARYHRDSNGWNDIGYNFLVDQYGQVFEGRAGGIDQAVIGAQAQGYNSSSTGIATASGRSPSVPQPEAGLDALARLIGWKLSLHGVPTQGQVVADLARRRVEPLPERHAGDRRAHLRPPRRRLDLLPRRRRSTASSPTCARAPRRYAGPLAGITVHASTRRVRTAPVQLSGSLHFPDGSSPAGAPLQIEFAVPGAAFAAHRRHGLRGRRHVVGVACRSPTPARSAPPSAATAPGRRWPPPPIAIRVLPAAAHAAVLAASATAGRNVAISGTIAPKPTTRAGRGAVRAPGRAPLAQGAARSASRCAAGAS